MSAQYMTPINYHSIKHPFESKEGTKSNGTLKKKKTIDTPQDCFPEQYITRRVGMCTLLWQKTPNDLNPLVPVLPLRLTTKK